MAGYRYQYENKVTNVPIGEINGTGANAILSRQIGTMDLFRDGKAVTTGFLTYLNSISGTLPTPTVSVSADVSRIRVDFLSPLVGFIVQIQDVLNPADITEYSVAPNIPSLSASATNGREYSVRVIAFDGVSESEPTAPVTVRPLAAPPTPTDLSAAPLDRSARLTWNLSADPYVTHIMIYRLGTSTPLQVPIAEASGNTYTVTGLTNGVQYGFFIRTKNTNGTLSDGTSANVTVIPVGIPAPPGAVSIISADNSVTISWGRSASEADVVGYYVDVSINGDISRINVPKTADVMRVSAAGINGSLAQGIVRSYNSGYVSAGISSPVIVIRPPPSVTSITNVIAGDAQCVVTWNSFNPATTYVDTLSLIVTRVSDSSAIATIPITPLSLTERTVTGLTNGVAYSFKLRATNTSSPDATESVPYTQTPYPVPPTVTAVTAVPTNAGAVVSWTLPGNTTFVSSYRIDISTGGAVFRSVPDIPNNAMNQPITGLTNNTLYSFYVVSINPRTTATASTFGTATPRGIPGTPTGLAKYEDNGFIDISWSQVGGLDVDGYKVSYKRAGTGDAETYLSNIVGATNTSVSVTGLTNGVAYELRVRAYNNVSTGDAAIINGTPLHTPFPPTGVTASPGITSINLSWTASTTPIASLSGYRIYVSGRVEPIIVSKDISSYTIENLVANTTYTVYMTATNTRNGFTESAASGFVQETAYAQPEGAPSIISADASNARIDISWSITDIDPNIIAFDISVTRVDTSASYIVVVSNTTLRTLTIGNGESGNPPLVNNVAYILTIRQRNPVIYGPWSGSVTRKPLDRPPVVTGFTATAGQASVLLTWVRPTVRTYVYSYEIDVLGTGGAVLETIKVDDEDSESRVVSGLTNGTQYGFVIRSVNDIFKSADVGPVYATPLPVPPTPTITDLSAGDAFVAVAWTITDDTFVSSFDVSLVNVSTGLDVSFVSVGSGVRRVVFAATNGVQYRVRILARNAVASSGVTLSAAAVTPKPVPPAVQSITAVAGIGTVTVTWVEPSEKKEFVNKYELQIFEGGVAKGAAIEFAIGVGTRTFTVAAAEITNGLDYSFSIRSVNEWYASATIQSTTVRPLAKPAPVSGLAVDASDGRVIVRWNAVTDTVNTSRLRISYDVASANPFTRELVIDDITATSVDISGLANQTLYGFRIRGENLLSGGNGDYSATLETTPRSRIPNPVIVSLLAGNASATLTWTYTGVTGSVDFYRIIATPAVGLTISNDYTTIGTTIYDLNLVNGVEYTVTIQGFNTVFSSDVVSAGTVIPRGIPANVAGFTVNASNASVICSWTASEDGASTTGYQIEYTRQTTPTSVVVVDVPGRTTDTLTISDLDNNVVYDFRIRGYNPISAYDELIGYGNWSAPSITGIVPRGVPVAPVGGGTLVAGIGYADVTWSHGVGAVLADIDSYVVEAVNGSEVIPYEFTRVNGVLPTSGRLTGLTNGLTYTVRIYAKNNLFQSDKVELGTVTPLARPAPVTGLTVTPSDTLAICNWTGATDGFTTSYKVRWTSGGGVYNYVTVNYPETTVDISGLQNNTTYTVSIIGVNAVAEGIAYSTGVNVIPRGRPLAPTAGTLVSGVGKATLTWSQNGTAAELENIDSYVIYARSGSEAEKTYTAEKGDSPKELAGLTNGVTYTVFIKSVNNVFESAEVSAGTVIPTGVPAVVSGPAVDASDAEVTVRWTAATDGFTDGYDISYNQGGTATVVRVSGVDSVSKVITGLTNNVGVAVAIRGYNSVVVGEYSEVITAVPRGRPIAPTVSTLVAGVGEATLTWSQNGTEAELENIDSYVIYARSEGFDDIEYTAEKGDSPKTLIGLTNGRTYSVFIKSINNVFESAEVSAGTVKPLGIPVTPTLTGTATDSSVTLTWEMSSETDISGYIVMMGSTQVATTLVGTLTTTISGLVNRTEYTYTVVAYNTNNTPSATSNSVTLTPRAIPVQPSSLSGMADISEVVLDWVIGSEQQMDEVDTYVIEMYAGTAVSGTPVETVNITRADVVAAGFTFNTLRKVRFAGTGANISSVSNVLTYEVTTLENGSSYTFRIRLRNLNGDFGAWSSTLTLRPLAVPPVPTITNLRGGDLQFEVTVTIPSAYGGENIDSYIVTYTTVR